jgi:hypothetical protein
MYYTTDVNSDVKVSLAATFPNWAFPGGTPSEEFLIDNDLKKVEEAESVPEGKIVVPAPTFLDVDGVWKNYSIVDQQTKPTIDTHTQTLEKLDTPLVVSGVYTEWEVIDRSDNEIWEDVRNTRDWLLITSDNTQADDVPNVTGGSKRAEWAIYRQELRDIPQSFTDPKLVSYPNKPS